MKPKASAGSTGTESILTPRCHRDEDFPFLNFKAQELVMQAAVALELKVLHFSLKQSCRLQQFLCR
jgi:hypothetical protein